MTPQQAASPAPPPQALDVLVRQWQRSGVRAQVVAADLAAKIRSERPAPWQELPPIADLAEQYQVSYRTVTRAKQFLADAGLLRADASRYVVAPPAAVPRPEAAHG